MSPPARGDMSLPAQGGIPPPAQVGTPGQGTGQGRGGTDRSRVHRSMLRLQGPRTVPLTSDLTALANCSHVMCEYGHTYTRVLAHAVHSRIAIALTPRNYT